MILGNPAARRDSLFTRILLVLLTHSMLFGLSAQGIIGTVTDAMSRIPVPGAAVHLFIKDDLVATAVTDNAGLYQCAVTVAGRVRIMIHAAGYMDFTLQDLLLDGYSTLRLEHPVEPSVTTLEGVTVIASSRHASPFIRTIRPGDLMLVAGNFEDPVRITHGQPGIVLLNDQTNQLSARGQSPIFNSWHLEGLEIVNPNHTNNAGTFSDQPTTSGGGVNLFSAQALGSTDVYLGINPMSVGRVTGAVIDMHLYESTRPEWRARAGLIGLELGGGTTAGQQGMIDFNLRYSFTGILTGLGADFGGERIGFYDGLIAYTHSGTKHKFKAFAWGGKSENHFDHVEPLKDRQRYKDFFDIDFESGAAGAGLRYDRQLQSHLYFKSGISYSSSTSTYHRFGQYGPIPENLNLEGKWSVLSAFTELTLQHSRRWRSMAGLSYVEKQYGNTGYFFPLVDEYRYRPYLHSDLQISTRLGVEAGIDIQYERASFNRSELPGYRGVVRWAMTGHQLLFAGIRYAAGPSVLTGSQPASLVTVRRSELGYRKQGGSFSFSLSAFHQVLDRLLVNRQPDEQALHLADIFEPWGSQIPYSIDLTGMARQYGAELDAAFLTTNGWRFLFNATPYKSERGRSGQDWLTGRYDGQYSAHGVISKEWTKERKGRQHTWNTSLRGIVNGGLREDRIDPVASTETGTTIWINQGSFIDQLPDYKRVDLSIARTIADAKLRWRYALDIQNVAGISNTGFRYFDPFLSKIVTQPQLGIIPVLSVQASW